mmetsp:Transcript_29232/g.75321  ORF Transcript_29232/g.75321 Transcript_29232/m.75321 type:complete len:245 (+) Transcript_29232:527-1261(+)
MAMRPSPASCRRSEDATPPRVLVISDVVLVYDVVDDADALSEASEVCDEERIVEVAHRLLVEALRVQRRQPRTDRLDLSKQPMVASNSPRLHGSDILLQQVDALGEHRHGGILRAKRLREGGARRALTRRQDVCYVVDRDAFRFNGVDLVRGRSKRHRWLLIDNVHLGLINGDGELAGRARDSELRIERQVEQIIRDLAQALMDIEVSRLHRLSCRVPADHLHLWKSLEVLLEARAYVCELGRH